MEMSLRRIETSTAEVTTAEASAERLAVEEREVSNWYRNVWITDAISSLGFISEERKPASPQCFLSFPND